jgi:hypothetical protein
MRLLPWLFFSTVYVLLRVRFNINAAAFGVALADIAILITIICLMSKSYRRLGLSLLVCWIAALVLSFGIVRYQVRLTEVKGDLIIAAIEDYRRDRGRYPDSLGDLVPACLPEIPSTRMGWTGGTFFYQRRKAFPEPDGPEGFVLGFGAPLGASERGRQYISHFGFWQAIGM